MRSSSIRFRLTAWYFAVFALGFSIFGVGAWFAMRESLNHAVDDGLQDRILGVKQFIKEQTSSLSIGEIRDEFREHSVLGPGGDLFQVCDRDGNWLYRSIPLEENQLAIARPDELGQQIRYENREIQRAPVRLASQRIEANGNPYTVQVAAPMHEFFEALETFRTILLIFMPLLLLVATAGGYWMSSRALSPVDNITNTARSISIQNLSARLPVPASKDELRRLSETLNGMFERLDTAVRQLTQFTADASHELRAPIAVIRTTAELALRRDRSMNEYKDALRQVLAESERTSELVDSLLVLARADSGTDGLRLGPMDIVESFREASTQAEKLARSKQISIQVDLPSRPVETVGDPQAIRRLFLILMDNAIKYTAPGGQVTAALTLRGGEAIGIVCDSGIGIAQEELPFIFDRFWRADKARSRELGGVGLGLSIARWIVERHGGQIIAQSTLGQGSVFEVRLPVHASRMVGTGTGS
ncbi:MAG: ATP-binding protein [Bryobacteraceae bacterium]